MTRLRISMRTLICPAMVLMALGIAPELRGEGSELPDADMAVIKALPFIDSGDTSDNDDDRNVSGFDECPYAQSGGKDVFYSIVPLTTISLKISLCGSTFDTRLYVLDAAFQPFACNEDKCRDAKGDPTLRSEIDCLELTAGNQYYIGVDGFDMNESGDYTIEVTECIPPPPFECPKGATPEGEACLDGGPDTTNAGCNEEPHRFTSIACGQTICGESWSMGGGGFRDTDWYQIILDEPMTLTLEGQFSYANGVIGFVQMNFGFEGSGDCTQVLGTTPFDVGGPGETLSITTPLLQPGVHWFFVASDLASAVPCSGDNEYWIRLMCQPDIDCPQCEGDCNGDGDVGFADVLSILANWGPCP